MNDSRENSTEEKVVAAVESALPPDTVTLTRIEELATLLASNNIRTLGELRKAVGTDVEKGIQKTAEKTGCAQGFLMALLIAESRDDQASKNSRKLFPYWRSLKTIRAIYRLEAVQLGKKPTFFWILFAPKSVRAVLLQSFVRSKKTLHNWKHHWPDALIVLLIVLLFSGVATVVKSLSRPQPRFIVVNQKAGLPSWHQISDADVDMQSGPKALSSLTDFAQVRDRYTLTALAAGAPLQETQLLSAYWSERVKGQKILSLPLKSPSYSQTLSPPANAVMIISPRSGDTKNTPAPFDVIVLSIDSVGDSKVATLAMPKDKFLSATSLLASHDVFLAQDAR